MHGKVSQVKNYILKVSHDFQLTRVSTKIVQIEIIENKQFSQETVNQILITAYKKINFSLTSFARLKAGIKISFIWNQVWWHEWLFWSAYCPYLDNLWKIQGCILPSWYFLFLHSLPLLPQLSFAFEELQPKSKSLYYWVKPSQLLLKYVPEIASWNVNKLLACRQV